MREEISSFSKMEDIKDEDLRNIQPYVLQSHKNPCSVAALLRKNFGSLLDFAKIFTKIHAVLSQNSLKVSRCFHGKIPKQNILFC